MQEPRGTSCEVEAKKGLQNRVGEQNCFLNVVIQGLWHLRSFRDKFQSSTAEHRHAAQGSCIHCALKVRLPLCRSFLRLICRLMILIQSAGVVE